MRRATSILLLLLIPSLLPGDLKTFEARPGQLIVLTMKKPARVQVLTPFELENQSFELADGSYICVFTTGSFKKIVIDTFVNGPVIPEPNVRYIINVSGNPTPPGPTPPGPNPNPDPDPTPPSPKPDPTVPSSDVGKTIQREGRKAGIKSEIGDKIATNFDTVASMVAAVSSMTPTQARDKLYELNGEITLPDNETCRKLFNSLHEYLNKRGVVSRESIKSTFPLLAEGFKSI